MRQSDENQGSGYSVPEQPQKKEGPEDTGNSGDSGPDRSQSELTEQNLLTQERAEADNPERKRDLEGELEEMADDIEDANSR